VQQVTWHFHSLHFWGTHKQPAKVYSRATLTSTRFVKQVEMICHLMHADFAYAGFYTFDGKEREARTYTDTIGYKEGGTLFMEQLTTSKIPVAIAPAKPRRALGLWASMALVIGNMIGSGIFLLPASLAPFGGISIVGWLFTAAGAMFLALLFARLAFMAPKVGGPYAYTRIGFGDFGGFWIAWGYWISVWTGNAALAVALVSYLQGIVPVLGTYHWLSALVAIGVIWLVTWINLLGIKQAGIFQVITTILKLLPLVALAVLGALESLCSF
jgi:Amino acid permease